MKMSSVPEFHERARDEWVSSLNAAFGPHLDSSLICTNRAAIAKALSPVMGPDRNYAFLPNGGRRDFERIQISHEPGCLDFSVGTRAIYRLKPCRLILERIEADPAASFYLLELDQLPPIMQEKYNLHSENRFAQEEIVELAPGDIHARDVWDEGLTAEGDKLPNHAKLIVRFSGGNIMIVVKGSRITRSFYDGRHSRMSSLEIRSFLC